MMRWAIWCGVSLTRYMRMQASRLESEYTNKAGNPVAVGRADYGGIWQVVVRLGKANQHGGLRPPLLS